MESLIIGSSWGLDDEVEAAAFAHFLALLEDQDLKLISLDDGYVECPGKDRHTTPNADSDCKVCRI